MWGEPSDKAFVLHRRAPYSHPPTIAACPNWHCMPQTSSSAPACHHHQYCSAIADSKLSNSGEIVSSLLFSQSIVHIQLLAHNGYWNCQTANYFHVLLKLQSVSHLKHIQLKLMNWQPFITLALLRNHGFLKLGSFFHMTRKLYSFAPGFQKLLQDSSGSNWMTCFFFTKVKLRVRKCNNWISFCLAQNSLQ